MQATTKTNAVLGLLLFAALTVTLSGCAKAKDAESPKTNPEQVVSPKLQADEAQRVTCEKSIKAQMKSQEIPVKMAPELKVEITELNLAVKNLNNPEYSFGQIKNETETIDLAFRDSTVDSMRELKYFMHAPKATSLGKIEVVVAMSILKDSKLQQAHLIYQVQDKCDLELVASLYSETAKTSDGRYSHQFKNYFADGKNESDKTEFSIPEGAVLLNLVPEATDKFKAPRDFYTFNPGLGVLHVVVTDAPTVDIKEFNFEMKMKSLAINVTVNDQPHNQGQYGKDSNFNIAYFKSGDMTSWTVPLAIWENVSLSTKLVN